MSIKDSGHHFIAIVGGAVAGAEAAWQLSKRGFRVVVFDQGKLPYGKIEDGLPMWHYKLRDKEEESINRKIDQPNITYVPCVRLGRDLEFSDLLSWGFTAILLATGAWRDRPVPLEGIEPFIGKDLIYQNPLVYWFNHRHEPGYSGPQFDLKDNAIVIGGGLASLDVAKILMIDTVQKALKPHGIDVDIFTLEHGIAAFLEKHNLTLEQIGLKGCTLYYRRRDIDMPLTPMPTDTEEKLEKARLVRQKVLENFQKKYLFRFEGCCIPNELIVQDDEMHGVKFQRTKIEDDRVVPLEQTLEVRSPMLVSSIGSIPEQIPGLPTENGVFKIKNPQSCQIHGLYNVFAIGNAVTGKGNINESVRHGREITEMIMDSFLDWHQDDYENWHRQTSVKVKQHMNEIIEVIERQKFLPDTVVQNILENVDALQVKAGYDGDFEKWVKAHTPPRLENML